MNSDPNISENNPSDLPFSKFASSDETNHMEAELRLTLEEIARLQNSLAEANMKILALQNNTQSDFSQIENKDSVMPVIIEFTQHIHTIRGYLDLLLNESVGMLGTFQKRFLERIANAVDQMQDLVQKMDQLAEEPVNKSSHYLQFFSLTDTVSESISLFTEQIRIKEITLKVDLNDPHSNFYGDRESVERILNIILANACSSAQSEGTLMIGLHELQGTSPLQYLLSVQTNGIANEKRKPQMVNLDEFKDIEIIVPGLALPIKDFIVARNLAAGMQGVLEIFTISDTNSLIRLRLPSGQIESDL